MEQIMEKKSTFTESFKESKDNLIGNFKKGWAVFKNKFSDSNEESTPGRRTTDVPFFEPPTMNTEERKEAFAKKRIEITAEEIFDTIDGENLNCFFYHQERGSSYYKA